MMTDRELLELAAKALGWALCSHDSYGSALVQRPGIRGFKSWNPLYKNDHALELAVDLKIEIHYYGNGCNADMRNSVAGDLGYCEENAARNDGDIHAAVRRAIVRAAAIIGESKEIKYD